MDNKEKRVIRDYEVLLGYLIDDRKRFFLSDRQIDINEKYIRRIRGILKRLRSLKNERKRI